MKIVSPSSSHFGSGNPLAPMVPSDRTLVRRYFASKTSFDDLAAWVQDHEPYWDTLPYEAPPRRLAARIMLMAYELWGGSRPEEDACQPIREVATTAAGAG